jgi:alpha-ketoglutaric semialdehyde dehydrogenase
MNRLLSFASLQGTSVIGGERSPSTGAPFCAFDPAAGEAILPEYRSASLGDVERAAKLAEDAIQMLAAVPGSRRGAFLEMIASNIENLGQDLASRVMAETGLPAARVQAETARTCAQARLFANLAAEGSWVDARIDTADRNRKPAPKPDIRSMLRPLGPIAVFGASNFPLAFSVAGGDTVSALAAGNPVIVKAHPAHPGTSEMVGDAILQAVRSLGLPVGTFALLYDSGYDVARELVRHAKIKAVGFTGSRKGGQALMNEIALRAEPIPFFGEMSSINPVFFLQGAFREGLDSSVQSLFASLTVGSGQFCTKPGLIFVQSQFLDEFASKLRKLMESANRMTMLTPGIANAYLRSISGIENHPQVTTLVYGLEHVETHVRPALFQTTVSAFLSDPSLSHEMFGPAALLVGYSNVQELLDVARNMEAQLTATMHGDAEDLAMHEDLLSLLERKVGRMIWNGFPTGVEVGHGMVHGGPWPATSDSRFSSVGARAIDRFARPACFQDFPQESLPDELKDSNPLGIWRTIDGNYTREAVLPSPAKS